MTRIGSKQFADAIIGQELTTSEISAILREKYPDNTMSRALICHRLKAMVGSPHVDIERKGQGNTARYHLKSYTSRYLRHAEKNYRACANHQAAPDKTLWHFNSIELQFCQLHKMFDQALSGVNKYSVSTQENIY